MGHVVDHIARIVRIPMELVTARQAPDLASSRSLQVRGRLDAALDWIQFAATMAGDGGISKGYDVLQGCWAPSYPETTGYTIPTLLNAATVLERPDLQELALDLADFLVDCATREGGVVHWRSRESYPIVFDTGQVIFGWLAAFEANGASRHLQAAARAGDWLVSVQNSSGSWKLHQHLGVEKVIDTRVAWALLALHRHTGQAAYRTAAVQNLLWARQQQNPDGWFAHCAFVNGADPFTHTIVYTAEGLLEGGCLLGDEDCVRSAKLTADALLTRQHPDGRLSSTFDARWRETGHSSCLVGNCQAGLLWLRLYELHGRWDYRTAAEKAITFVARAQNVQTASRDTRGGIPGSWPIYGQYERLKYPNWAAKFFVDGLLALGALSPRGFSGDGEAGSGVECAHRRYAG